MQRSDVVREYFKLIVLLNRGNKLPNQKTKIDFKIEAETGISKFYVHIGGSAKLLHCQKSERAKWEAENNWGSPALEQFFIEILNSNKYTTNEEKIAEIKRQLVGLLWPDHFDE